MSAVFTSQNKDTTTNKRILVIGSNAISKKQIKALIECHTQDHTFAINPLCEQLTKPSVRDINTLPLSSIHKKKSRAPIKKAHFNRKHGKRA